ncbi:UNVERIFIED_CONTAM: hypothetical protein Slati_1782300 [Sesamum latifolium]|uniref:Uncharacterized protein n=1 Tax=Sesamum latifolium TaxID=2727402 RepID=A0AAW2WY70_9LAMI
MTWMVPLTELDRRDVCAIGRRTQGCWSAGDMTEKLVVVKQKSGRNENKENRPDSGRKWMGLGSINSLEVGELTGGGFEQ